MVPTVVFLPGIFHGQKSLVGHSPWGRKELDDWAAEQERTSPQSAEARFLNQVTGSLLWRRLIYKPGGLRAELPNPEQQGQLQVLGLGGMPRTQEASQTCISDLPQFPKRTGDNMKDKNKIRLLEGS